MLFSGEVAEIFGNEEINHVENKSFRKNIPYFIGTKIGCAIVPMHFVKKQS